MAGFNASLKGAGGLKIAWRHLKRRKSYTFVNVLGLSLGIACGIIIFTLVTQQLSFDNFHPHRDRIYRIVTDLHHEAVSYIEGVPSPLGKAIRNDYTFTDLIARVKTADNALISLPSSPDNAKFVEKTGVAFAEPEFFQIFNFPLQSGDPATCISSPNSAIITERLARKYFHDQDPIGQVIRLENKTNFRITGILKDLPVNTDRRQEIYLSYDNLKDIFPWLGTDDSWTGINNGMQCFVRLRPGIAASTVDAAFPGFMKKYYSDKPRALKVYEFKLQPLADIHFNPLYGGFVQKKYLLVLALVGLFLIGTACVNFINLATAQALTRAREVGVRKVLGSMRYQLFWQFIAETFIIAGFATILGFIIAHQLIPVLNPMLDMSLNLHIAGNWPLLIFVLGLLLTITFLSGGYPGLVMSGFRPALALKGKVGQQHIGGFSLRRILVTSQFAISQLLIISTLVIAGQIHYSSHADLGFDKDAVLLLPIPVNNGAPQDKQSMNLLRDKALHIAGVNKASLCFTAPASPDADMDDIRFGNRGQVEAFNVNMKRSDDQYLSTFGLNLAAGRNFFPADSTREFLVNETLVRMLNLPSPSAIIGQRISVSKGSFQGTVVGVIRDFHNGSFRDTIAPVVISPDYASYSLCALKVNMSSIHTTLTELEKTWAGIYPQYAWSYQFLDDSIAEFYQRDAVLLSLIEIFAAITIFIGCLGLYGMVSFMAVQKTKEIGVRKVLGAGIFNILWLFGSEFLRLLLIAFVVAAPIGWFVMQGWLRDFAYRIPMGIPVFGTALLATIFIAGVTVGYRTIRSALANPVKSLRSD